MKINLNCQTFVHLTPGVRLTGQRNVAWGHRIRKRKGNYPLFRPRVCWMGTPRILFLLSSRDFRIFPFITYNFFQTKKRPIKLNAFGKNGIFKKTNTLSGFKYESDKFLDRDSTRFDMHTLVLFYRGHDDGTQRRIFSLIWLEIK
jgi:hypothetical protein